MSTYTIYFSPRDFPGRFVCRRFELASTPIPRELVAVELTLEACRATLLHDRPDLVCLARDPSDEPQIVETWI